MIHERLCVLTCSQQARAEHVFFWVADGVVEDGMECSHLFIRKLGIRSVSLAARADVGRGASVECPVVAFVEVERGTSALRALSAIQTAEMMHGCAFLMGGAGQILGSERQEKRCFHPFSFGFLLVFFISLVFLGAFF